MNLRTETRVLFFELDIWDTKLYQKVRNKKCTNVDNFSNISFIFLRDNK